MFSSSKRLRVLSTLVFTACIALQAPTTLAQSNSSEVAMEEVIITGSRIRRDPLAESAPIMELDPGQIDGTGLTNLGDVLQDLPVMGSAINSQFNVPGNSGFPQDGSGIGAGAVQLSLRNVGAKRTLILVDGKRWVPGASASGVPNSVDMNTIPDNVIQRVEILQDGASAIYGSDAIGGVVNIITNNKFEGFKVDAQTGQYLSDGDGESSELSALWGAGNDRTHVVFSASYKEELGIETANRSRSAYPNPDSTSCDVPGTFCSSFTPQGRFVLGPNFNFASITLNDGVLNDGAGNIPVFDPANPASGDFKDFTSADRFNYNGPGFNFLRTPNERLNLYTSVTHEISESVRLLFKASYTNRTSATKGAPEPLCLGNGCGNRINDNFVISAQKPFNPFGVELSVANGNLEFFGRRPLESGPRQFFQDVNTYFLSATVEGEFQSGDRNFYWDITGSYGDNRGFQEKFNSHNAARLQIAMGDPAVCAATPNCVPFNLFGGQGPDGNGSFTQEMLDFVTYTQRDFSEQTLSDIVMNLSGDIMELPAGTMGFAVGLEYRDQKGSFRPDPIAERGETAGIPSGRTVGEFDVKEYYGELAIPLIDGNQYAELNVALRNSKYSTASSESTYKVSGLWRPIDDFSVRASVSTGLRAPGIGELFGGAAREDFTFLDPCADVTAVVGSNSGGRDTPQPQTIIDNCATLNVPVGLAQTNPQLSAVSAGNSTLDAETSDSWTAGLVYSPGWADDRSWINGLTTTLDFYNLEINDAVQGRDPGDVITACVNTLNPEFCNLTPRTSSGQLGVVDNVLQNIGAIEASGFDVMIDYRSPDTRFGQFGVRVNATHLSDYTETTNNVDGSSSSIDRTGTHTDETFARAFPDLKMTTTVNWIRDRWNGNLAFRWTDEMETDGGGKLDSVMFTDLQVTYSPYYFNDALKFSLGFNNLLDEDPPVCFPCGVIGLSTVSHDLPGRVGYFRVSYQRD